MNENTHSTETPRLQSFLALLASMIFFSGCALSNPQEDGSPNALTSITSWFVTEESKPDAVDTWGSKDFAGGVHYEGEFKDGLRHGRGVQTWPDGARYDGEFANDKRNGQGIFTWPSLARYEGMFVEGKRHGHGIFTWPNGARYEGNYRDGQRDGPGVFQHPPNEMGQIFKENQVWSMDKLVSGQTLSRSDKERVPGQVQKGPLVESSLDGSSQKMTMSRRLSQEKLDPPSQSAPLLAPISDDEPKWVSVERPSPGTTPGALTIGIPESQAMDLSKSKMAKSPEVALPKSPTMDTLKSKMWSDPETGITLAFIPGGCFPMGSDLGRENEKPVHEVCLDSFWMGIQEVTQKQWRQVMGFLPKQSTVAEAMPVENVSWNAIDQFMRTINKRSGINFSLPTEAQWEYACTGGGLDHPHCGEGDVKTFAWITDNADNRPHLPGELSPNRFGLYDMTGNLWEWVADFYDENYYRHAPRQNPPGPSAGRSHVFRGGSWLSKPEFARASLRYDMDPNRSYSLLGFRVAASRVLGLP